MELKLRKGISTPLANGDGLCFISGKGEISGMKADTVSGSTVTYSQNTGAAPTPGTTVYRSFNHTLEKAIEHNPPVRMIQATARLEYEGDTAYTLTATASGSGATASVRFTAEQSRNRDKAAAGLKASLSKRSGIFSFTLTDIPEKGPLPFLPASALNSLRRELASGLEPRCHPAGHDRTCPV